jgi:diaminopimelate decarboxylase/aspartate kinase
MHTIVSKFGGTSVSSKATWDNIVKITQKHLADGLKPVLVCSARSHASNGLEQLIEQALLNHFKELETEFATEEYLGKNVRVRPASSFSGVGKE